MSYDPNNIFAKILNGDIPCDKIYEDEHVLAFNDIQPLAPTHVLIIPKGQYCSMDDFSEKASAEEITAYIRAIGKIGRELGLDQSGYRILSNMGQDANQEVPHLHVHLVGGKRLGRMLPRD